MIVTRRTKRELRRRREIRDQAAWRLSTTAIMRGRYVMSRIDGLSIVWSRSERTGRPRVVSVWRSARAAMLSLRRVATVAERATRYKLDRRRGQ